MPKSKELASKCAGVEKDSGVQLECFVTLTVDEVWHRLPGGVSLFFSFFFFFGPAIYFPKIHTRPIFTAATTSRTPATFNRDSDFVAQSKSTNELPKVKVIWLRVR